ncbi:hypothetical protein JXA88_19415 [Candidatus Fermentibacteria bacterium]|nr:hypothetical protein [Candidatus Fermentibacteria bacterium]
MRQRQMWAPVLVVALCICTASSPAWGQRPGWEKTRIDLTLRNTEINAALQLLTEMAGLNIVSGPEVKGTVSLRLVQVPLGEALNAILVVNGFGYVEGDNLIKILPLQQIGRAITQTYALNYASAKELEGSLNRFVSESGSVKGDEGSNTLIVTDIPDNLRKIGQLVEQLDRKPYQVLIESHVVDLKVSGTLDYGIDWLLVNYDNPRSYAEVKTSPELGRFGEVRFGIIRSRYDFDNVIRAVQENSDAKILSSPRIVALNHKEAEIHVGQEVPYTTVDRTEEGVTYSTSFRKTGTILNVTPHVTNDGNVLLQLHPEQSFVTEYVGTMPVVDSRSARTEMLLGSGQTAVIGGLRKSDYVLSESGIPFLSRIPLLGSLFKGTRTTRTDIELMVFVTPYILQGEEIVVQGRGAISGEAEKAAFGDALSQYEQLRTRSLTAGVEVTQ